MDYELSAAADALRARLRALITEHIPPDFLGAFTKDPADQEIAQRFCKTLAADRLLALGWPTELGGGGGTVWEQTVVREEMWAHHEPRGAQYMGINWVGPAIMRHGTAAQRSDHLPRIAAGEVIWCQGFSEPDSGSDLASLKLAAVRDGDGWRVNGQKIWTSYAALADWCFLLTRTSRDAKKHHGISVFLVPMDSPGLVVRPIQSMLGPHHLNEMFFDEVWVPDSNVLGVVGEGWDIVREVLAFERIGIARYARVERMLVTAREVMGPAWADLPGTVRVRWARSLVQTRSARLLAYKVIDLQELGAVRPIDAAPYRVAVTTLDQTSAEVLMDIAHWHRAPSTPQFRRFERAVEDHWAYAQAATVASGSVEMQRILIGRSLMEGR
jgi:alkylation response protein AidB-like acyl-CoA dehydrogenase